MGLNNDWGTNILKINSANFHIGSARYLMWWYFKIDHDTKMTLELVDLLPIED